MALKYEVEVEVELKSPADVVWNTIKDLNFILPKALPEIYKSIEILEGDGKSVGTLRFVTYAEGFHSGSSFKSKIEALDEENKTVYHHLTESDILKQYKYFDENMTVKAKGEGSVLIWCCMYEKLSEYAPDAESLRDDIIEMYQKLDAYLLGNNKN